MSVLMLCGSPHNKGGNSTYFLEALKQKLNTNAEIYNTIQSPEISERAFLNAIKNNENIVFSFPLYVDSLPAYFLSFLKSAEKLADGIVSDSRVYVIVNNGFYDDIQNNIALKIIWKWCEKSRLKKGRALAVGAGGMAQAASIGKGPMAKVGASLDTLAEDIRNSKTGETIYTRPSFPRFMYKIAGNIGFTMQGKKNGLKKSEIIGGKER